MTHAARDIFQYTIFPLLERTRRPWIEEAREIARQIARRDGTVNVNQVREVLPPPEDVDPRVCGAIFNKEFERVGFVNSDRATCHGRPISTFRLRAA